MDSKFIRACGGSGKSVAALSDSTSSSLRDYSSESLEELSYHQVGASESTKKGVYEPEQRS